MKVTSFKDLDVWQRAMQLVESTYRATEQLPTNERYGLTAQIRRCVVSIPANVAEGHARGGPRVYLHHVRVAINRAPETWPFHGHG